MKPESNCCGENENEKMLPRERRAEISERGNRKRIETYGYGPYGVCCPQCGEFQPA